MAKKFDPFKNLVLDDYEQSIENSINEWVPVENMQAEIERYRMYAKAHNSKKKISLRVDPDDLEDIKKKAASNNIPYQTLISTVLHQYAKNKLRVVI